MVICSIYVCFMQVHRGMLVFLDSLAKLVLLALEETLVQLVLPEQSANQALMVFKVSPSSYGLHLI